MVFAFVQRFGQHVAGASIDNLLRCSHFIVDKLHVDTDNRLAVGQVQADASPTKDGQPEDESPPAYEEFFESPCFISTQYKDDRAVVKQDNIASHAGTPAHAKNCECKGCRDRRRPFQKSGTGRRHGYRGTPISTRTAATDLAAWRQSLPKPELQSQQSSTNSPITGLPQEALSQPSRLRGGDFQVLEPGSNRFAALHVERTKDEGEYQQSADKQNDHESNNGSSTYSAQPTDETSILHQPEEFSITDTLWHQMAAFDNWSDANADDSDLAGKGSDDRANASTAMPAGLSIKTNLSVSSSDSEDARVWTLWKPKKKNFVPVTTLLPGPRTAQGASEEMPWEEDDWQERELLGVRLLSWTRTRLLLRYTQGDDAVEYFVNSEVL
ncbi:hypothetical protein GJ744_000462 [Endocarpon pusillum]|uniref:Uncharacterized protein n=1 Tax=Endocarpon pusillum TaxID=364733 RepID=A0A8H7AES5_9EURO|nr:hypothetical protein GJ744_000462 [Endocarpon pusillum]